MSDLTFAETEIPGLLTITPSLSQDDRGGFGRPFSQTVFDQADIGFRCENANIAWNHKAHTLRGMHFQDQTAPETKIVFPVSGKLVDVIVDVRPDSPTFGKWQGFILDGDDPIGLLVPPLCAHGYLTLTDNAHLMYLMDVPYAPGASKGLNYADPDVAINWPADPKIISDRDVNLPRLSEL